MDEARITPHPGFDTLRERLRGAVASVIASYGNSDDGRMAAE